MAIKERSEGLRRLWIVYDDDLTIDEMNFHELILGGRDDLGECVWGNVTTLNLESSIREHMVSFLPGGLENAYTGLFMRLMGAFQHRYAGIVAHLASIM
ncbi:MAG: hypothetical protein HY740_08630 [Chloroflexi bacterium]|nr:hypothetical protein [Chloroflexota bacterium]